jgi:hypothetical protein
VTLLTRENVQVIIQQQQNHKNVYYFKVLLYKESLNSDGQQFYQYQQNEQSPLTSTD